MNYYAKTTWLVIAFVALSGMGFGCATQTQDPEANLQTLETEPMQVFGSTESTPEETSVAQQPTVEVVDDSTLRYTFDRISFSAPKGWMVNDVGSGIELTFADDTDGKASVTIRLHDESVDLKKTVEAEYPNLENLGWYEPVGRTRQGVELLEHAAYAGMGGGGDTVWYEHGYGVEVSFFVYRLNSADLPLNMIINSLAFVGG